MYMNSRFSFSIDATISSRLGRMANDGNSYERNARPILLYVDEIPKICLFATRQIMAGEEIRYDYGVGGLPWRKVICQSTPQVIFQFKTAVQKI